MKPGDTLALKSRGRRPVELQCLAANRQLARPPNSPADAQSAVRRNGCRRAGQDNASSLAFKLTYGSSNMFDGGDLTKDIEQMLVCPNNLVGPVVLYQTDSHGVNVTTMPYWRVLCNRESLVMNNGPKKGAQTKTMETLFSTPAIETVWQMHRNLQGGEPRNTAAEFIANQELNCSARFLKAVVEPEAGFTVQIAETGARRHYRYR